MPHAHTPCISQLAGDICSILSNTAIHILQLENNLRVCYVVLWTLDGKLNNGDFRYLQCNQQNWLQTNTMQQTTIITGTDHKITMAVNQLHFITGSNQQGSLVRDSRQLHRFPVHSSMSCYSQTICSKSC